MTKQELTDLITDVLASMTIDVDDAVDAAKERAPEMIGSEVMDFGDAGYLTYDEGLVVRTPDGSEYQVTITGPRIAR